MENKPKALKLLVFIALVVGNSVFGMDFSGRSKAIASKRKIEVKSALNEEKLYQDILVAIERKQFGLKLDTFLNQLKGVLRKLHSEGNFDQIQSFYELFDIGFQSISEAIKENQQVISVFSQYVPGLVTVPDFGVRQRLYSEVAGGGSLKTTFRFGAAAGAAGAGKADFNVRSALGEIVPVKAADPRPPRHFVYVDVSGGAAGAAAAGDGEDAQDAVTSKEADKLYGEMQLDIMASSLLGEKFDLNKYIPRMSILFSKQSNQKERFKKLICSAVEKAK